MSLVAILALVATRPPYAMCIRKTLPALELSGERPDDVAKATWETCKGQFEQDARRLADANPENTADVMDYARVRLVPAIATHVVRTRACRRTSGCSISHLSWEEGL
ncbi:hypothetical protein [Novosphingobium capsulatum]|uniref:hypothetical protein n=1 Tax=Novosphingobium capsulatum TaxID=13688 RepID=UPI0012ED5095|nr:hypothetical protein [Novosphingobium capsulatum]WQD92773.1 hypothetical protein U0041_17590 [Novosphingobium capsulatum]